MLLYYMFESICGGGGGGGGGLSGFRDFTHFCLPSKWWTIVHGGQKIELAQKIHASRGSCETHGNQIWWV